jgi:protoporphyrinogen oxidase
VVDVVVVRVPDAYPVYDSTYRRHLEILRGFLDRIANLHIVDRNGMHKYDNQDHSMYAGMLTVANLHGEAHDVGGQFRLRVPRGKPASVSGPDDQASPS